jgi:glycosyltransferase involved in cell wall biosynthesis
MSAVFRARRLARRGVRAVGRRLPGQVRRTAHAVQRRLDGARSPVVRPEPLPAAATRLFDGSLAGNVHGLVVFVVSDLTVLPVRHGRPSRPRPQLRSRRDRSAAVELRAACGLAAELATLGYGVVVRDGVDRGPLPRDTAAVVTLHPRFDPAGVPGDVACLAWAVDEPELWERHPRLRLFDHVLAASGLLRQNLALVTDRPVDVLPLAAEVVAERLPRQVGAAGVPSRAASTRGIVADGVFATIARGGVPLADTRLGLDELGLQAVPSYRSPAERGRLLPRYRRDQDGSRELAAELWRVVRREHTFADRARSLAAVLPDVEPRPLGRPIPSPGADRLRRHAGPVASGASATASTPDAADGRGATVAFFPDFRGTNPYQQMLYRSLTEEGTEVLPLRDATAVAVPRDDGGPLDGFVLHLHWTSAVLQVASSEDEARRRLEAFRDQVAAVQARGGRLVWTVHNVLSHEITYFDLEVELCRFLAERADLVHVMSEQTLEATPPHFVLDPARLAVVPHASYLGVYPDLVTRRAAREALGLADDEIALLALGGIRPYRGLDRLLDTFEPLVAENPRLRLLVAGKPGESPGVPELIARCEEHPRIVGEFTHVPAAQLQLWHRAADLAVLPYRAILNSGAFKLAQTFGLPVVAPREGSLRAALDPACTIGFDPSDLDSLARALREGVELVSDPVRAAAARDAASATAAAYPPGRMAEDFAAAVRPLLACGPALLAAGRPGEAR